MFLLVSVCCDTAQALVFLLVSICCDTAKALVYLLVSMCCDTAQALMFLLVLMCCDNSPKPCPARIYYGLIILFFHFLTQRRLDEIERTANFKRRSNRISVWYRTINLVWSTMNGSRCYWSITSHLPVSVYAHANHNTREAVNRKGNAEYSRTYLARCARMRMSHPGSYSSLKPVHVS